MSEDNKIKIRLEKHLWPDEIAEKKRKRRSRFVLITLCLATFCLGLVLGVSNAPQSTCLIPSSTQSFYSNKLDSIYNLLSNKWFFADEVENINEDLIDKALYGMSSSELDLHTTYMSRQEVESFTTSIDMGFVGIGVQFTTADDLNMITRVFHNAPADKAGVLPGDVIYSIDGELVEDFGSSEIESRVKGVEGTDVVIGFLRDNEVIELTITRGAVQNTAYGEMLDDEVGYLQIYQFGSSTGEEVAGYLQMMSEQGLKKLIVDVRDDGGGYLEALVDVASSFLPAGTTVMKQVYADGSEEYSIAKEGMFENINGIVILTNGNSASAAEVFTLALKEQRDDVTIVGTTTYGKGTVQVTHVFSDGSALKYTTSKWVSPSGVWVNKVGIEPDIEVRLHDILYEGYTILGDDEAYRYDSVGEDVRLIQLALDFLGYSVERTDGYFDRSTEKALIQFQNEFGIEEKGILNGKTQEAVFSQVTKTWSLDKSYDVQLNKAIELLHQ